MPGSVIAGDILGWAYYKLARKGCGGTLTSAKQQCPPRSVLRAVT
jgi:hypothetical protein